MQDKAQKNPKIKFLLDTVIEEIIGNETVTGIRVKNVKTQEKKEIPLQGVFIAIGHEPNTALFRSSLKCNESGYLLTEKGCTATTVPGVFAAGDVADHIYRQAVTAAGSGCMAAMDAETFLEENPG